MLPSEIQNIAGSPSKKDSDLPVKLRPKFSIKTKREADLKATEWLLESHGSLHATENKRHRAYASFISGGAYTAPCYRTIKNHTTMLGTDGRQLSADFVRRLAADGSSLQAHQTHGPTTAAVSLAAPCTAALDSHLPS